MLITGQAQFEPTNEDIMLDNPPEISRSFAVSRFGEYYLPSINRNTFEKIDSTSLYNERFKQALSKPDTLHIIIGLDSGLLANYVMERPLADGAKFIFVELPEVLSMLSIDIPEHLADEISVISFDELNETIADIRNNVFLVKGKYAIHRSIAVDGNYLEPYSELNAEVEKKVEHESFSLGTAFNQKLFIKTQLTNVAENLQPASVLRGQFNDKTCIVLGGGPSLDNNIDWIKANADRLVIIAASRIVGKLIKLEIKPDIIVSVDPQSISFDVNKELMSLEHDTLLVYSYHVTPQIIGQWRGAALYTGSRLPWNSDHDNNNIESVGPTVTNSAIEIAREMGFSQILLCGVDFCHSQSGITHTAGTYGASLGPDMGIMYEWVETNCGEMAETPIQLMYAIQSLAAAIEAYPGARYINLSPDAAKVNGVEQINAHDITLPEISAKQRALLAPAQHLLSIDKKCQLLGSTLNALKATSEQLAQLNDYNQDALQLVDQIEAAHQYPERIGALASKLDNIESSINANYSGLAKLVKFYGYYEFSHFLSTKKVDDWSQQDVTDNTRLYYQAFSDITNALSQLVDEAIARVSSRLAEHQAEVDIHALCERWDKDAQWGRALIWQQQHPQLYAQLTTAQQSELAKTRQQYHAQFVVKAFIDPSDEPAVPQLNNAFKKLHALLHYKHLLGITKMVQYTAPYVDSDLDITRLHNLAKSYQYRLENRLELALDAVQATPIEQRQEAELKQIILLALKLNRLPLALAQYAQIITYSDEYLPQYAHALYLNDNAQDALATYLDYLDKYPQDIPVMLKLGIFLANVGQIDGARACFENVLSLDEDNQAAISYIQQLGD